MTIKNNENEFKNSSIWSSCFNKKFAITKQQFKKLFIILSIILVLDFPILPLLLTLIDGGKGCNDYGAIVCTALIASPLVILGLFWCALWHTGYIVFFTEHDHLKLESKNFFSRLNIRNIQYNYSKNKLGSRKSLIMVIAFFCLGVAWIFLYEIFELFRIATSVAILGQ